MNMIHGFSEKFLNELAERYDLPLEVVTETAHTCHIHGEHGELPEMLREISENLHDEDWFDSPDDGESDYDDGQPDEMQEWHDYDPDC